MKKPANEVKTCEKKSAIYHKLSPVLFGAGLTCEAVAIASAIFFPPMMMYLIGAGCLLIGGKIVCDYEEMKCDAKACEIKDTYMMDEQQVEELSNVEKESLQPKQEDKVVRKVEKNEIPTEEEVAEEVLRRR